MLRPILMPILSPILRPVIAAASYEVFDFTAGLPSLLALSRASEQLITNASGILIELTDDEYGVHHTPAGTPLGYLAEGALTNDATQSNVIATSPWSTGRLTITAAALTGPDGATTAAQGVETTGTAATHTISRSLAHVQDVSELVSMWFQSINGREAAQIRVNPGNERGIDLATGAALTSGDPFDAYWIETFPGGWYRVSVKWTDAVATGNIAWTFRGAEIVAGAPNPTFVGDAVTPKGIAFWGCQHIAGGMYPTSPIIAAGTSASRAACRMAGSFPFRTPTSIRIVGRSAKGIGATDQHFCAITEASYTRLIQVYRQSSDRHLIVDDGVNDPIDLGTLADDTDFDEVVSVSPGGALHLIEIGTDYTGIAKHWDGTVARIEVR